jgi:outer membrane protein assembly factor BamB
MNWKCLLRCLPAVAGLWFTLWVAAAAQAQNVIAEADPMDWPYWRGPEMNGISREKNLPESWSPDGENLLWKKEDLASRSTPIVMKGKLYTLCRNHPGTEQEGEKVICVDAATGDTVWENAFNVFLSDVPDTRVGWSSVVGDPSTGNVYALGVCGLFQAIDGETGKTIWSHSLSEQYGILTTYGGRTNFPIVYEDLVIISGVMTGWGELAVPAHRFLAFDKRNGVPVWITSTRLRPEDTTYSSPVLTVFNGEPALVVGAGDGSIYAMQPRTGKVIWKYDASIRGINTTPVIAGTTVYCGHSEEIVTNPTKVGAVFALDGADKGKELWSVEELGVGKSAPLFVDDRLYVIADNATLFVLDTKNKGAEIGRKKMGTIMTGSAVYGDGKIYAGEATGRWYIFKPGDNGVEVVHQLRLGDEILGSPIISHGRIYLPTGSALYCIGNKDQEPSADPRPEQPAESPVSEDEKPALLQIAPCEMLMKPGEKVRLQARLYNAKGQYLKQAEDVQWSVEGTGSIDEHGYFHAPRGDKPEVALITGKSGEISGTGRIRISPPLPWSFDFNDGKIPPTWIGVRGRFQPREVDGEKVLVKVTTVPKGTRSQSWMGQDDLHDYTMQADVRGALTEGKLPDIGLIDQRYTFDMMGAAQQLQIRSWTPMLEARFAKTVPFEWKPDTWYTMKFQSENKDGEAVLRGKVWPRGDKEPEEWQVEAADKTPNTIGSPGLFGNAQVAEIYLDNIKVYPNSSKEPAGSSN